MEVEYNFASGKLVSELERAKKHYGLALGIYSNFVTCPRILGREPIGSFCLEIESKEVDYADESFAAQSEFDLQQFR